MQRVDAHFHLWDLSRGDYHWLNGNDEALAPIAKNFDFADIKQASKSAEIQKYVIVQAAATEAETDYLLSLANKHKEIGGVVGWADISSDEAIASLTKWSADPKFKGIRPMLQDIDDVNWLLEVPSTNIWDSLVELGLRFDALVQPRHLQMLNQFSKRNPELSIVIDHAAKPKHAMAGDKDAFKSWSENINILAQNAQMHCKVSGLLTEIKFTEINVAMSTIKNVLDVLLQAFGPQRLMWGSDWPVLNLVSDYQNWNEISYNLLSDLDEKSRQMILSGTANKFYDLGDAQ